MVKVVGHLLPLHRNPFLLLLSIKSPTQNSLRTLTRNLRVLGRRQEARLKRLKLIQAIRN